MRGRAFVTLVCLLALAAGGLAARPAPATARSTDLAGRVFFDGVAPEPEPAQLAADPFCAGAHDRPLSITPVRVDGEGGLADAFVWVVDGPASGGPPEEPALLDQVGCVYLPGALAVRVGQRVVFRNSDQTLHNINVQPRANPGFNIGQPFAGMETERVFAAPEVGIPVRCDVHAWMSGTIAVFDHPWFAVSASDGRFVIPGLPAGEWTVEAWHPVLGSFTGRVTAGEPAEIRYRN